MGLPYVGASAEVRIRRSDTVYGKACYRVVQTLLQVFGIQTLATAPFDPTQIKPNITTLGAWGKPYGF